VSGAPDDVVREVAQLPSYSYFAVTESTVFVLEFRFSPPRVEREVARWPRHGVVGTRVTDNPCALDIVTGGCPVQLESTDCDDAGLAVIALLVSPSAA
jgi:hypothetical protein